jgi:protein-L-isoaspartate O-methyltransferase
VTVPPLVARAKAAAAALGFEKSCRDEDGMVMHVLAARRGIERVAEIGTGTGVGTAWLASALAPGVPLVTAEQDERFAAAAAELFADDQDVGVLHGDWREVLPAHAPSTSSSSTAVARRTTRTRSSRSPRRVRRSCWTTSRPTGDGTTRGARAGSHTRG